MGKYYNGLASCQQLSVRLLYEMSAKIALFGPTTKNYSLDVQHFLHWMRDITSLSIGIEMRFMSLEGL